jgi:mono/diheme cytochrome c family protein
MRSVLILLVVACGGEGTQIPRDQAKSAGELLFNGYTKPDVKCFSCHDGTGAGTKWGPALDERVPRLDDPQLRAVILDGHDKMPAFRAKLSVGEVAELVTWLRERFGAR